jgi:hypothetical protein
MQLLASLPKVLPGECLVVHFFGIYKFVSKPPEYAWINSMIFYFLGKEISVVNTN